MTFELRFTPTARAALSQLEAEQALRTVRKQVLKALGFLEANPRHPSLNTHRFLSLSGPNGEEVFEAYAQNKTPGAYRIFFCYGPDEKDRERKRIPILTIVAITPHT